MVAALGTVSMYEKRLGFPYLGTAPPVIGESYFCSDPTLTLILLVFHGHQYFLIGLARLFFEALVLQHSHMDTDLNLYRGVAKDDNRLVFSLYSK